MILCKNIRDFNFLTEKCPFCNSNLETGLIPISQSNDLWYQASKIINKNIVSKITFQSKKFVYESKIEDNKLNFNLIFLHKNNIIFSVDIDTGTVTGSPIENIQRILNEHELVLIRKCISEDCFRKGFNFAYQSSLLVLGHKSCKIYPVTVDLEMITVIIKGSKFTLITANDLKSSYLLDSKTILVTLPAIELHKMSNKDVIINKIKTYVLFS